MQHQRTWQCDRCTFINTGEGVCVVCREGQPPPLPGKWKCEFCTLFNSNSKKNCVVCNHPRSKKRKAVSQNSEVSSQLPSRSQNQRYRDRSEEARITIVPKSSPQLEPKAVDIYAKSDVNRDRSLANHNRMNKQRNENFRISKTYNQKPRGYEPIISEQKSRNNDKMMMNFHQNQVDIRRKHAKSIDIDNELSPEEDNLITIEPKRPVVAKASRAPPPYSNPYPLLEQQDRLSDKGTHSSKSQSGVGIGKRYMKPAKQHVKQRPAPVVMMSKNMNVQHPMDDDVKYGDISQPYSRSPYLQQSLSQALDEDSRVSKVPKSMDDFGRKEEHGIDAKTIEKDYVGYNNPRSKKPHNLEESPQVSSRNQKQRYRNKSEAARITIIPKPPPQPKPKAVEFYADQSQTKYNQMHQQPIEICNNPNAQKPRNYESMSYDQKSRNNGKAMTDIHQNQLGIHRKPAKSIDIDNELSLQEDNLITIEPKHPVAAKALKAPPPYSTPSPPSKQQDSSSDEETQSSTSQPNIGLNKLYMNPAKQNAEQKSAPVVMMRYNYNKQQTLNEDVKYDIHQPYSRKPYVGQPLSQVLDEDLGVKNAPKSMDDLGTEELIRRLLQEEMCMICNTKQGIEIGGCGHKVCKKCGEEQIKRGIETKKWASQAVTCPVQGCRKILPQNVFRHFGLDQSTIKKLEIMQQKFNMSRAEGLVKCPSEKCGYRFVGEPGKVMQDRVEVGRNGKPLSKEALKHKAKHRFRCPQCKINFCGECSASPYHLGDTCESFRQWKASKKCRFCEATIDQSKITHKPNWEFPGWDNVCHLEECQQRRLQSCGKVHDKCGHPCNGIRGERQCLPCFHPDCVPKGANTHEDFCSICWVEAWSAAPCVQLECKHVVHCHCLLQKLDKRWPAARIVFKYLRCGECNKPMKNQMLKRNLYPHEKLRNKVEKMAIEQLKREGFDEDKRLREKGGKYYNNKALFAMDRLAYYICYKCKKPYYGGMRKCDAQDIDKWNEKHLVCGGCRMGSNKKSCKIHGTEFIVWKCKFCCSRGSWFCWGNTHFCDKCHKRQEGGDYLNRKPMSAHPKCPGRESGNPLDCPLKVKHPPNGTNFCLGCNVCLIS